MARRHSAILAGPRPGAGKLQPVKEDRLTEVITVSNRFGAWRVVEEHESRLVLERLPQRTAEQMRTDHGLREATPQEFDELMGHLPSRPND